jgi:GNAT superfamily N-acetyltransferase
MGTGELSRQVLSGAVRDARAEDAEAMSRLCEQLGYPAQSGAMPQRLIRLQRDPNARALVADAGEGPVGLATVHLRHTINHEAPIAQLTLLVVDEAQRSRGVGRALVEEAERWAHAQGCHRIVVTTALQRAGAHAFYERIGYRHTGRRYGKDFD